MKKIKKYKNQQRTRQTVMLALFLFLVFIMIVYMERSVNRSMELEQLITLKTVSGKVASNMEDYFERQWSHLDYIEQTMKFSSYDTQKDVFHMLERVKMAHGLEGEGSLLILIDEKGYYYTAEAGKAALWRGLNDSAGILPEDTALVLSDLAEVKDHLEQYICFMKKLEEPITAADGSRFPYLVLAADERVFEIDLSMGEFGTITDAFVITSNGRKVNSQMGSIGLSKSYNILSALKGAKFILGDSYGEMVSGIEDGKSGVSLIEYQQKEYFISFHSIGIEDWSAVFIMDREHMVDRITPFIYQLLVVSAVGFTGLFLLVLGVIFINRDIERRREHLINDQLQASAAAAERANKAKSEFLSRMSHDIRTPLNGIIGMTAIAEKTIDDKKSVESCLKKITSASDHLLELINEVLDIARIENGKVEVKNEPLNLKELLGQLSDMNESRIAARSLIYQMDLSGLTHPYVIADRTMLNQILLNILGNAVKYTENNGSIRCTAYDKLLTAERAEYHFIVEDTGIGMSAEYVTHIFDHFSQEEIGARTSYEGTGLGMAITKDLVDLMQGTIAVKSEKGVGSTFEVTVTFALCREEEIKAAEKKEKERIRSCQYHVLLVEDNEINREIAEFLLQDAGISCQLAEDGVQAVEAFRQSAPGEYDAILMDILMPNMDGHEAARQIRAMERQDAQTIPIFAMTANAYQEDQEKSIAAGMNVHLTKPMVLEQVLEALQTWCRKEEGEA